MSLAQFNGKTQAERKRVWYGGSTALKVGQAVHYANDDTVNPVSGADPTQNERGQAVADPATANLGGFAGVVDSLPLRDAAGSIVASWIDIVLPRKGDVVNLWSSANATKNSTILGTTNAGANTFVAVSDATFNVDAVAIALQTVDRSSTNGFILSKFI